MKKSKKIIYALYARQACMGEEGLKPIKTQLNKMKNVAKKLNLEVKEVFSEVASAYSPSNRPEFNKMIEMIENGKINGILCLNISRLSRNFLAYANFHYLIEEGKLKSIRTIEGERLSKNSSFCRKLIA